MSIRALTELFGRSRQGYYQRQHAQERTGLEDEVILACVSRIRTRAGTSRWGVRKLQLLVNRELAPLSLRVGRDRLFALLGAHDLLSKPRRRAYVKRGGEHLLPRYSNLIRGKVLTGPNQLWVADITYLKSPSGAAYFLYLVTDAYSQMVVGWHLSDDLLSASALRALAMALKQNGSTPSLTHHSDRGAQYRSVEYLGMLKRHSVSISMSNPSSPQENAIAERLNGILKAEWLYDMDFKSLADARTKVRKVIAVYNGYRPHNSLGNLVPEQVHWQGFLRHGAVRVVSRNCVTEKEPQEAP